MQLKSQLPLILATAFLDILWMSLFIPLLPSIIYWFNVDPSLTWYTQAVYAIGMFIWWFIFGRLSDTYGRKRVLTFTSIINLASYAIMLVSIWTLSTHFSWGISHSEFTSIWLGHFLNAFNGWTPLFVIFLVSRFVWGLWGAGFGVIQAYIADISTPTERMKNMWYIGASFGIAFLIGPAVSGILSNFISARDIILITFFIILVNVVLIYLFLAEPVKHIQVDDIQLWDFHFSRMIIILLFLSFGATLAFSAIQAMSTQFYTDRFLFTTQQIGYTMAMVGFVSILYQAWLVKYVRKYLDEYQMLRFAFVILIFGFIGFSLNSSPIWLFFWVIFFPLGMWSFNPAVGSLFARNAGRDTGKVMWYNTSIQSVWQIIWPILAWLLYIKPGTNLPFLASSIIFVILFSVSLTIKK